MLATLLLAAAQPSIASSQIINQSPNLCDIRDFGAIADDQQPDTKAIQAAIDQCGDRGGKVVVPSGRYLLGQTQLRSNMELYLAPGSILQASTNLADFAPQKAIHEGGEHRPFIFGAGISNVSITGLGVIDGSGPAYWGKEDRDRIRFGLILQGCNNVKVRDISIRDTPMFLMGMMDCDNVVVDGVTLTAPADSPNTDGLQVIDSHDVRISNCLISVGDDGIVPKMRNRMIERLQVNNCRITSDDGAIKFGTRSSSGMRDSLFSDITITDSRYGIAMFMLHGGVYENIRFSNIRIATGGRHARHFPIFADIDDRAGSLDFQNKETRALGRIHGLTFDGIDVSTGGNIMIGGHPRSPVTDLSIRNLRMRVSKAQDLPKLKGKPLGNRTFKPVPGSSDFTTQNAHIVLGNVAGAQLTGIDVKPTDESSKRPMLALPGSSGIVLDGKVQSK
jgi:polygalacturonase